MVVKDGISDAAVRDVQPLYMVLHPLLPMVVKDGISAAAVRDVQP